VCIDTHIINIKGVQHDLTNQIYTTINLNSMSPVDTYAMLSWVFAKLSSQPVVAVHQCA
jgi:hypothetical protein